MARRSKAEVNEDDEDLVGKGHNSSVMAGGQLLAFVERIERLEEEKKTIGDDIKEVYAELKGTGFDTKIVRKLIAERKKDRAELEETEAMLDLYRDAIDRAAAMRGE